MEEVVLQAHAKVNLTMDVLSRRADGYHEVDLLMQSVSLCDTLILRRGESLSLTIDGGLPVEDNNLILRAARLLAQDAGVEPCAQMHLEKRVPVAAGLGGGSGDAAAALAGLNVLWGLHDPQERLQALGAKLGADVPFCLAGGLQRATGIGTVLTPVQNRLPLHFVILKPCQGLLTKEIFGALRLDRVARHPDTPGAARAMERGDADALIRCMGNVLETVAVPRQPEIEKAMGELMDLGARHARMSGSGSAVFGLFDSREAAAQAAQRLKTRYAECFAAESETCGVKFI